MPAPGLALLYQLHLVDQELVELRERAAALDTGKAIAAELKRLEDEYGVAHREASALNGELKDLELKQRAAEDKIRDFTKKLYGGTVVSPREVANIEAEIEMLKGQREKCDERILELWDLVPPAQAKADELKGAVDRRKQALAKRRDAAQAEHKKLQEHYSAKAAERGPRATPVPQPLLVQYEQVRKRTGDTAMAVVTEHQTCAACGMRVPEKANEALKDDRLTFCESCGRILFRPVLG